MSAKRSFHPMKPGPDGYQYALVGKFTDGKRFTVNSRTGWRGPVRKTERGAILAWNHRDDAEVERRGMEAAFMWMQASGHVRVAKEFSRALQRGEVMPAAKKWRKRI